MFNKLSEFCEYLNNLTNELQDRSVLSVYAVGDDPYRLGTPQKPKYMGNGYIIFELDDGKFIVVRYTIFGVASVEYRDLTDFEKSWRAKNCTGELFDSARSEVSVNGSVIRAHGKIAQITALHDEREYRSFVDGDICYEAVDEEDIAELVFVFENGRKLFIVGSEDRHPSYEVWMSQAANNE